MENLDGSAQIIVTGGKDWNLQFKEILIEYTLGMTKRDSNHTPMLFLDSSDVLYMQIESQILASTLSQKEFHTAQQLQKQLEETRTERLILYLINLIT